MRLALITGIFPPDIGGPATHAADTAEELRRRGHAVVVVTLWDGASVDRSPGLIRFPRRWPWFMRDAALVRWFLANRARYDVVYATGLETPAVAGATLARRPSVVKVVGDLAWERGRRLDLTSAGFEDFQRRPDPHPRIRAMRALRNWALRKATVVTAPTPYLASVVEGWLAGPSGVRVIPGGVRAISRPRLRGNDPAVLNVAYAGRLVRHKNVGRILEAVASIPDVRFEIVGNGPELGALRGRAQALGVGDRVTFSGSLPHRDALERIAAADVLILASGYEGLPHVAIEALACGTPIVAPAVGGMADAVRDGVSGLLLDDASSEAIAGALSRLRDDPALRRHLAEGASGEGQNWRFDSVAEAIESTLAQTLRGLPAPAVFLGRGALPRESRDAKLRVLLRHLRPTVIARGVRPPWIGRVRVVSLPSPGRGAVQAVWFYGVAPLLALAAAARRRAAVICQSPYEGFGAVATARLLPAALRPPVVVEVHGDWRTAARLYGSHRRRLLAPAAERAAAWALRRADRVRVVSKELERLVRAAGYGGGIDRYPTFTDVAPLLSAPPAPVPTEPVAAFVGGFARVKGADLLLEAWSRVASKLPSATLVLAGDGWLLPEARAMCAALGIEHRVRFAGAIPRDELVQVLDRASVLVVPSRSEGLPRVILEAFARGRAVVGTRVGGIPDLVEVDRTGALVAPEDPEALARALTVLLPERERLEAMGREARRRVEALDVTRAYEAGTERLAGWISRRIAVEPPLPDSSPPRNLLVFNLAVDADDPILGFTTSWLRALAARVARVDVVTMRAGGIDLPENVHVWSVGKEQGYGEPRRAIELYRIVGRLLRERSYDACFSHMMPLFSAMAAPMLELAGVPVTLWYAHASTSAVLRVATMFADAVVTTSADSFPLPARNVIVTGQGIDTQRFRPLRKRAASRPLVLAVSRVAPAKRIELLLGAVAALRREIPEVEVRIIGPVAAGDHGYAQQLVRAVREAGLDGTVRFSGPIAPDRMPEAYAEADVLVSLTGAGSGDKVVLEAMSCGIPVVTANPTFAQLIGEAAPPLGRAVENAAEVARAIRWTLDLTASERVALGERLRALIVRDHSLERLADRLLEVMARTRGVRVHRTDWDAGSSVNA